MESALNLSPGRRFRQSTSADCRAIPGVFNALAARLAERAGFAAVYQSGAALSAGVGGVPDIGLMTREEFVQQAGYLVRAVSIPVISDSDTGFGDVRDVERTLQAFEAVGVAGIHLEDQEFPKRCGHLSGKAVVSREEMVEKLQAAVAARRDPEFVIIARTDARAVNGIDDAIARAQAYVAAGADMIFPEALETRDEFARFARELTGVSLIANITEFGKSPLLSVAELAELGYRAVLFPVTLLRVAMRATETALRELAEQGSQRDFVDRMQTRSELYDVLGYKP
jgi:methylisocitrate lyase